MEAVQFIGKKSGRTLYRFVMSGDEYAETHDEGAGGCVMCGAEVCGGVEPDARKYECEVCGGNGVYGLEELLLMGYIRLVDEAGAE